MAFSTQKDFFYVPFMNENVDFECKRACVKLKSYDSTIDDRSWAMDETKQSKFLTDLVTCGTPVSTGAGSSFPGAGALGGKDGLRVGDSVLECANTTMGQLQSLLQEKQKQLELSNEQLKTVDEENKRIKDIMGRKYDSSHSKDFYNKIQKLASSGKLSKSEEQELLAIYQKVEDMNKAYEVLQAENSYIKRLLEKLSLRATLESIKQEPEKSTDTQYLQNTVNALRKEVTLLRKFEDAKLREKQREDSGGDGDTGGTRLTQRDAENLKAIIRERNALRDKCKTFKELEKKVQELMRKSKAADNLSDNLSSNLDNQTMYINNMEKEMKRMQLYYEDEMEKAKYNEQLLKCQLDSVKEELMQAKYEAQKSEVLQMEVACLRNEITKRELALNDYDVQYKQLMGVIAELQGSAIQNLNDSETQTANDFVEDLAFFASATLEEIMKELAKRNFGDSDSYHEIHAYGLKESKRDDSNTMPSLYNTAEDCCRENERLQKMIKELKSEKDKATDCAAVCADALKRLESLELQNIKLKTENESLQGSVRDRSGRLNDMSSRLSKLDDSIGKTKVDTESMGKNLRESLKLVKDISDMQLKNQQLTSAVNAISTKEGEQAIEDLRAQLEALRRQLREEQEKNQKCQAENDNLQKELKQRGLDIAKLTNDLQAAQGKGGAAPGTSGESGTAAKAEKGAKAESSAKSETGAIKSEPSGAQGTGSSPTAGAANAGAANAGAANAGAANAAAANAAAANAGAANAGAPNAGAANAGAPNAGAANAGAANAAAANAGAANAGAPNAGAPNAGAGGVPLPPPSVAAPDTANRPGANRQGAHESGKPTGVPLPATGAAESRSRAIAPGSGGPAARGGKGKGGVGGSEGAAFDPYQDFVDKNAANMTQNLKAGNCLEKELRKILEAFIKECGFCFCHCKLPKSKFYSICYKILHQGIQTVSFRELVYVHKKIFAAADKLHSGCLLNIILADQTGTDGERLKCCSCKNILCCDNSEEMLREKVYKLEQDIELARQYLETFKSAPTQRTKNEKTFRVDDNDSSYSEKTYRQCKPQTPRNKQLKQLKARILKCSDLLR